MQHTALRAKQKFNDKKERDYKIIIEKGLREKKSYESQKERIENLKIFNYGKALE